jgi:hypothetical protein
VAAELVVPAGDAHTSANEHLGYLGKCDEDGGEGLGEEVESLKAVVSIHESVYGVVHGNEIETGAYVIFKVCTCAPRVRFDEEIKEGLRQDKIIIIIIIRKRRSSSSTNLTCGRRVSLPAK